MSSGGGGKSGRETYGGGNAQFVRMHVNLPVAGKGNGVSERPPVSAAERPAPVQRAGERGWQMSSEITDAVQLIRILFDGTELFLRVAGVGIKPVKQLAKLFMGILAREKMEGKTCTSSSSHRSSLRR